MKRFVPTLSVVIGLALAQVSACTKRTEETLVSVEVMRTLCLVQDGSTINEGLCRTIPISDADVTFTMAGKVVPSQRTDSRGIASVRISGSGNLIIAASSVFLSTKLTAEHLLSGEDSLQLSLMDPEILKSIATD